MKKQPPHFARLAQQIAIGCLAWIATTAAYAQTESLRITMVEEHWELCVGQPTPERSSPQASMVMSPSPELDGLFFLFTLNHLSTPNFVPGGMQVQMWNGDESIQTQNGPKSGTLYQDDELVTWAQRLEVSEGFVTFQILNGLSSTWGEFGGQGYLKLSNQTSLGDLNGYRPAISLGESEVGYAGNRVVALALKKLVWKTDDGELHEMEAPIAIDTDLDP